VRLRQVLSIAALLTTTLSIAACGSGQDGSGAGKAATPKEVTMDEQQATQRAEEIIHQAVDGMSPKPTLKRVGPTPLGACVARDDHGSDNRVQLSLTYQLTGVPGGQAKNLVRQARDAWVELGYKFQSSDANWSEPFPSVSMRTEPDDFWMDAITGVVDRAKGDGLASIGVTSPCFAPRDQSTADSASLRHAQTDERAERRARDHSSRIYDALQARHASTQVEGDGLQAFQDTEGAFAHHAWSTQPLTGDQTAQVMGRAQAFFESASWTVRHVPAAGGIPAIVALQTEDGSIAQVASSTTGAVRVAVTTPAARAEPVRM
jgi:hypothetical protein